MAQPEAPSGQAASVLAGWSAVAGQDRAVRLLTKVLEQNKVAHAYLFVGPAGSGKRSVALLLARSLCCRQPGSGSQPCGACVPCRKLAEGNHPEVELLQPEGATHRISDLRNLQARIWRRPAEGPCRVIIIDAAERMQAAAANSLLKILEEPPGHCVFMLLTENAAAVLPTIRSRCQGVVFTPLPAAAIEQVLTTRHGIAPALARSVAALAGGSIGQALRLAADPAVGERRELAQNLLAALPDSDDSACLQAAEALEKRPDLAEVLLQLQVGLRDLLVQRCGAGDPVVDGAAAAGPGNLPPRLQAAELTDMFGCVEEARRQLERNANTRLVLDVLFLRLAALAAPPRST